MSKSIEKLKAIQLRRKGLSIKDISKKLNVSTSSVSVWCQNIKLTDVQSRKLKNKQILAGNVGRQKGADTNRRKKQLALSQAKMCADKEIRRISKEDLFYLGLGIYWGEGVKSRSGQTSVVNSDPRILKISLRWFEDCFDVARTDFRPYVYISQQHKNRESLIMSYWQKTLNLPKDQFKSPIYIKQNTKQKYENNDDYFGVVALRVLKSANLKYRILALISRASDELE